MHHVRPSAEQAICLADVIFAMDSVPVVLSLTTSPFLLVASQVLLSR